MSARVRLLGHPHWIEGESWGGYLLRVAEANYLSGIRHVAELLSMTPWDILSARPKDVLDQLCLCTEGVPESRRLSVHVVGKRFISRFGRSIESAACVKCLSSDVTPYIRAEWEFPLEVGCRIHRCALLVKCENCGRALSLLRRELLQCNCGSSLLEQQQEYLDDFWVGFRHAFSTIRPIGSRSTFDSYQRRERLAASVVQKIALYESGSPKPGSPKKAFTGKLPLKDARSARAWFENWPNGFISRYTEALKIHLPGMRKQRSYLSSESLLSKYFPRLRRLIRQVARRRMRKPRHRLTVEDYLARDVQTLGGAAVMIGHGEAATFSLARAGLLPGAQFHSPKSFRIATADLQRLRWWYEGSMSVFRASAQLGLAPSSVERLAESCVVEAVTLGSDASLRVKTEDCANLLGCMLQLALRGVARVASHRSLDVALRLAYRENGPSGVALLMSAILAGRVDLFCGESKPINLASFYLISIQVKRLWRPTRTQRS